MSEKDIFERDRSGEVVDMNDPDFYRIYDVIHDTMAKLQRMNSSVMSAEEVREVFADVTGTEVDDTLTLFTPVLHGLREEPEGREERAHPAVLHVLRPLRHHDR